MSSRFQFVGEFRPLKIPDSECDILHWEGAIYNRTRLLARLDCCFSDTPALLNSAIRKWGSELYKNVEGRYLLVYRVEGIMYVARGVYDSPEFFYSSLNKKSFFALDLETLLGQMQAPIRISTSALIHQLSYLANKGDGTPFCDVRSLPAGQAVRLTCETGPKNLPTHFPHCESSLKVKPNSAKLWLGVFSSTLIELSEQKNIALFLSGGMDSGALAAIATHNKIPIKTITFGLSQHPSEDESKYGASLAKALDLEHHRLEINSRCFENIESFPISLRRPALNPYQRMINEGYACANQLGVDTLWTGSVGDDIYRPKRYLIQDLWEENKYREIISIAAQCACKRQAIPHSIKTLMNHLLSRKPRSIDLPSYINKEYGEARERHLKHPVIVGEAESIYHRSIIFNYDNINGLSHEQAFTEQYNVERVHPYMHPAIIELGLSTPAHEVHNFFETKLIMRESLKGIAPQNFIQRKRVGVLNNYFLTGWKASLKNIQSILFDSSASWPQFVDKETMIKMLKSGSDQGYMLASNCLALELWLKQLREKGLEYQFA